MLDQADHLRHLMHGARTARPDRAPRPRLLVVTGGKGGVGTTTIAVNLAAAFARIGRRTVLVDGNLGRCDVAALCDTLEGYTIGDVLAGRQRVAAAIQAGPGDLQVLSGAWATGHLTDCDAAAQERLILELIGLDGVDQIVIDAGCGVNRVVERFWRSSDHVLLVSTPDSTSVMDAYATVKTLAARHRTVAVQTVINRAANERQAGETHQRLAEAGRRFLGLDLAQAAAVAESPQIAAAAARRCPFVPLSPACPASQSLIQLAANLCRFQSPGENHESEQTIQAARA
ncbi:MAG: hypothetical protein B7Z73_11390 [Planctomycetia bacterium 21-64-5]|nr:MAG: hypothetical protein B7Z73_11390 [Planctomycetia bacterium 21-64-5]HQU45835.1 P-loop NTPase [Pirellulales bacterium]